MYPRLETIVTRRFRRLATITAVVTALLIGVTTLISPAPSAQAAVNVPDWLAKYLIKSRGQDGARRTLVGQGYNCLPPRPGLLHRRQLRPAPLGPRQRHDRRAGYVPERPRLARDRRTGRPDLPRRVEARHLLPDPRSLGERPLGTHEHLELRGALRRRPHVRVRRLRVHRQ
jgi:hypothetical protein